MKRIPRTPTTCGQKIVNQLAELYREAAFAGDFARRHALPSSQVEKAEDHINDARWAVRGGNCRLAQHHVRQSNNKLRAFRQMVARVREHGQ